MFGGLAIILSSLILTQNLGLYVLMTFMILSTLGLVAYSYLEFKKLKNGGLPNWLDSLSEN